MPPFRPVSIWYLLSITCPWLLIICLTVRWLQKLLGFRSTLVFTVLPLTELVDSFYFTPLAENTYSKQETPFLCRVWKHSCSIAYFHRLIVAPKLEVSDPRQKKVKLGSLMLGQKVKKQEVLVNHSPLDLSFTLLLNTNTLLDPRDLSFSPAGELTLMASGGSCNVEIQFSPRQHTPPFTAELQAEFAGLLHPLLTIQGCCQVPVENRELSSSSCIVASTAKEV